MLTEENLQQEPGPTGVFSCFCFQLFHHSLKLWKWNIQEVNVSCERTLQVCREHPLSLLAIPQAEELKGNGTPWSAAILGDLGRISPGARSGRESRYLSKRLSTLTNTRRIHISSRKNKFQVHVYVCHWQGLLRESRGSGDAMRQLPGVQGVTPWCAGGDSPVCRGDPNEVACRPESARPAHCSARCLVLSVE